MSHLPSCSQWPMSYKQLQDLAISVATTVQTLPQPRVMLITEMAFFTQQGTMKVYITELMNQLKFIKL